MTPPARHAVVVAGGDPIDPAVVRCVPPSAYVIAADSGLDRAWALGLAVDLAVGDFDSVSPASLARASAEGCRIERHPAAKDHTDLELALLAARARGMTHVTVVGGHGGRVDHFLANALVLASDAFADLSIDALMGAARLSIVRHRATLAGRRGELVSLLALGGPAREVRTEGLRYPLRGEDLWPGSTRGISNELVEPTATVTLTTGVLLAVRPQADGIGRG